MKNSQEYLKKVSSLYNSLKSKQAKVRGVTYDMLADALVYAIVSENMSKAAADAAIKRFSEYFVDLNDLRVSGIEEIIEVLGEDMPATRDIASRLISALRAIYNEYNSVSLETLKKIGKRPAKQVLEKIEGTSRFVVSYCLLTSLQGHAIPLTRQMLEYLKNNGLVHPEADEQEIEGFLTKRISAADAYEFYVLLRRESESPKQLHKRKTTRETKIKAAKKKEK
jgi:endonuclease III